MPKWSMMIDDADDDDVPAALVKGSYSTTTSVKIYFLLMKKVEEKFSKLFHQVRSCVNVSLLTDSRPIVRVVSIRSSRSGHHQPTTEKSFTKSWQCNQLSDIFYFFLFQRKPKAHQPHRFEFGAECRRPVCTSRAESLCRDCDVQRRTFTALPASLAHVDCGVIVFRIFWPVTTTDCEQLQ